MPIPLRGDRSAWDTVGYPNLHARDIETGSALYHLPKDAAAEQIPQWDGEKWVPVDPPSSGGGGGGDPIWYVAGRLAAAANVSAAILITRAATIEAVYLYLKDRGTDGATTIDVKLNGNSIFTGTYQPSLSYDDIANYVKVIPTTTALIEGDLLTLDISEAATGAAEMTVVIALVSAPSGSGGGSGDMTKAVYDTDNDGALNNSELLDGHAASYFATADHTHPGGGQGDMLMATYDTDSDGIVDNSEALQGHPASDFASASHTHAGMGTGDMLKATYDQDDDGVVDSAENALALNGHADTYFATANHTHPAPNLQAIFAVEGVLAGGSGTIRIPNHTGRTLTIVGVYLDCSIAPSNQAIIVDIHKSGVTIFTNQANRPQIAADAYSGSATTIDVSAWADGEYLTMDRDQVGATTPGSDLTVTVVYC